MQSKWNNIKHQNKTSVLDYCHENILIIPEALHGMNDILPLYSDKRSSIFYKDLNYDLLDIEFYTNQCCIVYIVSGSETITSSDNKKYVINEKEAILFPKGLNLYSDFVRMNVSLNAYLIFFDNEIVMDFLANHQKPIKKVSQLKKGHEFIEPGPEKIKTGDAFHSFFQSLSKVYKDADNCKKLFNLKLLELLYLVEVYNPDIDLKQSISMDCTQPKRNIIRLMERYGLTNLSANDFAQMSGRSLSSFNREFKRLHNTTPKQWLVEYRLKHAYQLLVDDGVTVTEAANEVGYNNISHFIKAFREKYGTTPKQLSTAFS